MKIGLPIDAVNQLESEIAANMKTAPAFLVFDTENKAVQIIDTQNGVCSALPSDLDVVIFSDGMGRGMFNNLIKNDVMIFQTNAFTVKEALEAFEAGGMPAVEDVACCGHDDGEDDDHHHHGGGCCGGGGHGHGHGCNH